MISISNSDYAKAMRLLRSFARSKGENLRANEERRQAYLLVKKWDRKEKRK